MVQRVFLEVVKYILIMEFDIMEKMNRHAEKDHKKSDNIKIISHSHKRVSIEIMVN